MYCDEIYIATDAAAIRDYSRWLGMTAAGQKFFFISIIYGESAGNLLRQFDKNYDEKDVGNRYWHRRKIMIIVFNTLSVWNIFLLHIKSNPRASKTIFHRNLKSNRIK